jgi:toxin YoeB
LRLVFTPHGWEDYTFWIETDGATLKGATLKRVNRLIDAALRDPTSGIGKPEPLRHLLSGAWSRRITDEHRLVYLIDGDDLVILQARYHY